jgi:hypothetical protein
MFLFFGIFRKLVYVVLVFAIPLIAGEFIARSLLGDAVNSAIVSRIGGKAQVGFGTTPVLLQLVNGHLSDVSVSESKAQIGGLPTLAFNATLDHADRAPRRARRPRPARHADLRWLAAARCA